MKWEASPLSVSLELAVVLAGLLVAGPAGAQTWGAPLQTATNYYSERGAVMVDLDRDGNPDLVQVDASALAPRFAYQYGDGTGRFGPRQFLTTIILATSVNSADLDHDGLADLVMSGPAGACVHYGTPQGVPGPAVAIPNLNAAAILDLDRDGHLDLVGGQSGGPTCKVVFGDGARGFPRVATLALSPSFLANRPYVLDLDGDGGDEAIYVFGNSVSYYLQVLGWSASGEPVLEPSVSIGTANFGVGAIVDWDGDGAPDLLMPRGEVFGPFPIHILRHQGRTILDTVPIAATPLPSGVTPRQVMVSDFDGDGILDLLCPCSLTDMRTARGIGNGQVAAWVVQTGHPIVFAHLVDVTRDGVPDLVQSSGSILETHPQVGTVYPGAVPFGFGTEPCLGGITLGLDSMPAPGNMALRVRFANAPPFARGLVFGGGPQDVQGYPRMPGVLLHTGLILAITLGMGQVDGSGVLTMAMPIPNLPGLHGTVVHLQGVFSADFARGSLCGGVETGLVSSLGLTVTVQ